MKILFLPTAVALLTLSVVSAQGREAVSQADHNATIRRDGPTANPWFHTAQAPGRFESYAVASFRLQNRDFQSSGLTAIESVEITYLEAPSDFTASGPVEIFISIDETVSSGDFTRLRHNGIRSGINDEQFSDQPTNQSLGRFEFLPGGEGAKHRFQLQLTEEIRSLLLDAIEAGRSFSLIVGAPGGGTAATFAGLEHFSHPDPIQLKVTARP